MRSTDKDFAGEMTNLLGAIVVAISDMMGLWDLWFVGSAQQFGQLMCFWIASAIWY